MNFTDRLGKLKNILVGKTITDIQLDNITISTNVTYTITHPVFGLNIVVENVACNLPLPESAVTDVCAILIEKTIHNTRYSIQIWSEDKIIATMVARLY